MRFDLVDLRLFVAIVEAGSISGGAAEANLALASASARVAGMEAVIGAPLLERGRRGAVPTDAGRALAGHARALLGRMAQMRDELAAFAGGAKGRIRILSNTAALVAFALRVRVAERYCIEQILRIMIERAEKLGLSLRGSRRLALRQARRMLVHITRLYAQGESPRLSL